MLAHEGPRQNGCHVAMIMEEGLPTSRRGQNKKKTPHGRRRTISARRNGILAGGDAPAPKSSRGPGKALRQKNPADYRNVISGKPLCDTTSFARGPWRAGRCFAGAGNPQGGSLLSTRFPEGWDRLSTATGGGGRSKPQGAVHNDKICVTRVGLSQTGVCGPLRCGFSRAGVLLLRDYQRLVYAGKRRCGVASLRNSEGNDRPRRRCSCSRGCVTPYAKGRLSPAIFRTRRSTEWHPPRPAFPAKQDRSNSSPPIAAARSGRPRLYAFCGHSGHGDHLPSKFVGPGRDGP